MRYFGEKRENIEDFRRGVSLYTKKQKAGETSGDGSHWWKKVKRAYCHLRETKKSAGTLERDYKREQGVRHPSKELQGRDVQPHG